MPSAWHVAPCAEASFGEPSGAVALINIGTVRSATAPVAAIAMIHRLLIAPASGHPPSGISINPFYRTLALTYFTTP